MIPPRAQGDSGNTGQHRVLGVLGGGQLGAMMLEPMRRLGIQALFLDPDPLAPVGQQYPHFQVGSFRDYDTVLAFGRECDVCTYELEEVHQGALAQLASEGKFVAPSPSVLATLQDKSLQKAFYLRHGLPTAPFRHFESKAAMLHFLSEEAGLEHWSNLKASGSIVWKSARGGYDGKGVRLLRGFQDAEALPDVPCLLEATVEIAREFAVLTVRHADGTVKWYDPCLMEFDPEANLVRKVFAGPTGFAEHHLGANSVRESLKIAGLVAEGLGAVGVLAVEFFLDRGGRLWINETAPRPHNSGHYTLEAAYCSQFEQHIRAVMGLPLGDCHLHSHAVMYNLVGQPGHEGPVYYRGMEEVLSMPGVFVHLYGKAQTRPYRKMGHATVLHRDPAEAARIADQVASVLQCVTL